jgi:hypothetical protein
MPIFICSECGHYGNTALSHYWSSLGHDRRCHICLVKANQVSIYEQKIWGDMALIIFDKAKEDDKIDPKTGFVEE